jgi:hypothetical protein
MRSCISTMKNIAVLAVLLTGLIACGASGNTGQLSLSLLDATTDQYNAVYVTVKQVDAHNSVDPEGTWTTVVMPNRTVNLLALVNGVRQQLGLVSLAAGHYTQLRLIIGTEADGSANILSQAHPFANYVIDDSNNYHELKIPSGLQTGIKIVKGFDINENGTTELLLDFSASESVVVAGKSGKYLLKPTIKVLETTLASIINGKVTKTADATAVEGALVSAQLYNASAPDVKDQVVVQASTLSDVSGAYKLFIAAGSYNLVAGKLGFAPIPVALTTAADSATTQDFSLTAADSGNVNGTASILGGNSETFVTLSFRQTMSLGGGNVMIEIASINVANGASYSLDLPVGAYSVVSSTAGKTTKQTDITVVKGTPTVLDVSF